MRHVQGNIKRITHSGDISFYDFLKGFISKQEWYFSFKDYIMINGIEDEPVIIQFEDFLWSGYYEGKVGYFTHNNVLYEVHDKIEIEECEQIEIHPMSENEYSFDIRYNEGEDNFLNMMCRTMDLYDRIYGE